ncbi:unnamed protein product [Gordionus sp. m RMFG-2023]
METSIPYSIIEDIHIMSRWDSNQRFCVQINIPDACILIQKQVLKYTKILQNTTRPEVLTREIKHLIDMAMSIPLQDEEIHQVPLELISDLLQKNKCIPKTIHENIITALAPLLENNHPSPEICDFFTKHCKDSPRSTVIIEMFTSVVQRILKHNMCCNLQDFGKYPKMRIFVQEYIQALNSQNNGIEVVEQLVKNMHGHASICPHPGLLPNLVSVILSGIYSCYDEKLKLKQDCLNGQEETIETDNIIRNQKRASNLRGTEIDRRLLCYLAMIHVMSTYEDWRPLLSSLLQPIPFPDYSLCHELFMKRMEKVISNLAKDNRCEVHQALLGVREGKEGWLHLFCPANSIYYYDFNQTFVSPLAHHISSNILLDETHSITNPETSRDNSINLDRSELMLNNNSEDLAYNTDNHDHMMHHNGHNGFNAHNGLSGINGVAVANGFENEMDYFEGKLFCEMLTTLMRCCCKRKKFLTHMNKMLGPCMLLALREQEIAMEVLCSMLELDTIENHDLKLQIVTTLHSTNKGKKLYADLCDRLAALKELQQKGGPKRLTLPAKSTDTDLKKILSQGSFGNLECLSLAFTHVTSKCAEYLIKLPSLKYLNLWSTQFGDPGLQLITEHLPRLQVLNLCETPVTDKGLSCLISMKNLRKLNLNSTSLSAKTFEGLKEKLPALQECDIRYTDAW